MGWISASAQSAMVPFVRYWFLGVAPGRAGRWSASPAVVGEIDNSSLNRSIAIATFACMRLLSMLSFSTAVVRTVNHSPGLVLGGHPVPGVILPGRI